MENFNLLELQKNLSMQGILISFSGKFSQTVIEELGEAIKKYLESENNPEKDNYNIFSIFVEQTQNIKNYCTGKQNSPFYQKIADSCIVTIGKTAEGHCICSGNLIENTDLPSLVELIEGLTPLSKPELKKIYKEKLREDFAANGAGIGLIDVARKVSLPLTYSIVKTDDRFSFFTLKAVV